MAAAGAAAAAPIPANILQEMLRAAAAKSDTDTLRFLRAHPGLLTAPLDSSGRTALMFAAHNGRCHPLRALLAQGAPVDARTTAGATAVRLLAAAIDRLVLLDRSLN